MSKYVIEILKEVNASPDAVVKYKDHNAFKIVLSYAFDPTKKFILPEGNPPFKPDPMPLGMNPANFQQEIRRFDIFRRTDITSMRRETLFIQLLEGIHPEEAMMLIAVKDQTIPNLFPNITLEFCKTHDLVPKETAVVATPKSEDGLASDTKRGRGRPAGAKNKTKTA